MKRTLLTIMLFLFPLFFLTEGSLTAATPAYEQDLQLIIKSVKEIYQPGQDIRLITKLKNNSNKEIIVFWGEERPDILAEEDGGIIIAINNFSNSDPIYIKPGKVVKRNVIVKNLIKGKYNISLEYNPGTIPNDMPRQANTEIWRSFVTSNSIAIEVVEKRCVKEKDICSTDDQCLNINCSKYDTPVKEGHRPYCVNNKCKCLCYGCE